MARPKKSKDLTTQEKIDMIMKNLMVNQTEIRSAEEALLELRAQRKELEAQLQQEKINLLVETIESKNITLDKAKEIIDNVK